MKTILLLLFLGLTVNMHAQNLAPAVVDNSTMQSTSTTPVGFSSTSACLDGCDRQAIIDDYLTNYIGSSFNNADMTWTGNTTTCDPGTISNSVEQKILQRINYFRRLACISDDIYFDPVKNEKCQEAAVMGGLSHCTGPNGAPCDTYDCNTPNAIQASQNSNLTTNNWNYVNPIDMYMEDTGNSNAAVGHRRWMLFSHGNEMGNGIAPWKQVLWVIGNYASTPTYNNFIAYPSSGFFPRSLVYNRWSFAIPGANFTNASVSVKKNGESISATIIAITGGAGVRDPTLVWNIFSSDITFSSDEDVEYEVTVSGITGAPQNSYTYKVFAIKEEMPTVVYETIDPYCNDNGVTTAHLSAGAASYNWTPTNDSTQTIENLAAGTYHLVLTDINGCEFLDSVVLVTDTITTPHPGDGTPASLQSIADTGHISVSTTGTVLKTNEATGWWITKANPIFSDISDQATLDTAIYYANIQAPNDAASIDNDPSVLFLNDSLSEGIAYDCNNMDELETYYATPFVTSYRLTIPDTSCVAENGTVASITVGGRPGKFTSISPTTIDCRPDSLYDLPLYTLEATISGYTGTPGELGILIQDNNYFGNTVLYSPYLSGNGTYTFSQSDLSYYTPNDPGDPNWTTGLTVLSWHLTGNGMQNGNIELSLNISYPGDPGIAFPTMIYSSCIFGEPISFSCAEPLPVELISFTGKLMEDKVYLEWETVSETDNDYFTLERSGDGRNFDLLSTISGKEQTEQIQDYFYLDEKLADGVNYYRLSQTDFDGSSRFVGGIVVVEYQRETFVSIYPNPASTELNIQFGRHTDSSLNYELYDVLGRLVGTGRFDKSESESVFRLDIEGFSDGLYLLQVKDGFRNEVVSFLKR